MIVILDYGMGNLRSVYKAFQRLGTNAIISNDSREIMQADKLILPGVGHFAKGMQNIKERKLDELIYAKVVTKETPILGICLGMQLLTSFSEEGGVRGLNLVGAKTIRFNFENSETKPKVPHMGWNTLDGGVDCPIFKNVSTDSAFYFVHSYFVYCSEPNISIRTTEYGISFTSVLQKEHIFGVQFHPEKSHDEGLKVLQNFINL